MISALYFNSDCYFNYEYGFDYDRIPDLSCPEVRKLTTVFMLIERKLK